ncbi:uracil-DNA glycosylase [Paracoccus seriniphilus]|uniref:Type-4 uracil-DNA glycosylase n=1 Tax=Paracoccus seriniphilus TaxID=184748 RepID=A0A239PLY5_9RHOB|nr:uracil-DNA glycosylase [Paracoccus seriniphilus]WCR13755.1 uracil-DNA glycosylase [Paracoccus seriniphilus]SNT68637.1 DNA polymerase [Paracoccus seriniphilus]
MDSLPTYQGIAIDADTALALLEWQVEMGADEAMLDAPVDRFELAPRSRAADTPVMPPLQMQAPAVASPQPSVQDDLQARVAEAESLAARAQSLEALAAAQAGFDGIELKKGARNFCFADGNPKARVLILGEAPGDEEDRQGRPFVGQAGQLLDRMFEAIGLSRQEVDAEKALYITNVLAWRPPGNRDPSNDEISLSMPFVRRHVELVSPDLVVLMGNVPCQAAIGRRGILRLRGQWTQAFERPALPMTHPAYLLRTPVAKREAWADLLSLSARMESLSV